jgi:hypothetical protein
MDTTTATTKNVTVAAHPSKSNAPTMKTQRVPSDHHKGPAAKIAPAHGSSGDAVMAETQPESTEEVVKSRFTMLRGPEEPSGAEASESKKQKTSASQPYVIDFGDGNAGTLHLQSAAVEKWFDLTGVHPKQIAKLKDFDALNDGKTVAFPIFMPSYG